MSSNQTKPGENLEISVKTNPGSFVGLLGVDQSVLLLKKGNDIEREKVFDELDKFTEVKEDRSESYFDFKDTNVFIITNADKEFGGKPKKPRPYYSFPVYPSFPPYPSFPGFGYNDPFGIYLPAPSYSVNPGVFSASANAASFGSFGGSGLTSGIQNQFSRPGYIVTTNRPYYSSFDSPIKNEILKKPVEIRTEFPETWIFDSFEMEAK